MGFSVQDTSKLIRDRWQITLARLNGFCPLSKPPPTPSLPPALKGQYQAGWKTKEKQMKNKCLFILYFKFWRYFLQKVTSYSYQFFYSLLFYFIIYIRRYNFYDILKVYLTLSEKKFSSRIFVFYLVHSNAPHTLNSQNPLIAWQKFFVDAALLQ